jgi:glutamine amidotransferase PdxT
LFNEKQCEGTLLDDVDMVVFPGGVGDSESYHRFFRDKQNSQFITEYVNRGGRYLGICMGAYWAGQEYFNILQNADTVQYINRPNTDTRRPHPKAIDVTWSGTKEKMYFYDGCAIIGDRSGFDTIATYANGDAMAIVQNRIGLIGCHAESEEFWYQLHSWMKPHYHGGQHHDLLLEFVNRLMQQS